MFPWTEWIAFVILLVSVSFLAAQHGIAKSTIPLINPRKPWELGTSNTRHRAFVDMPSLIKLGLNQFRVFRMMTYDGNLTVLAPEFAKEIRNSSSFSVNRFVVERLHANIKGFEPWKQISAGDSIFIDAVRKRLMKPLENLIQPASDETALTLQQEWTNDTEWHTLQLKSSVSRIVTSLLARAFWGESLGRDAEWLRVVLGYSTDSFIAADSLHLWPKILRPVLARVLPSCRKIQNQLQEARDIMEPILKERSTGKQEDDALQWMEGCAQGRPYDPVMAQIGLAMLSLHSTTDMLTQVLYDLCERVELVNALREEVASVTKGEGLTVATLHKLKLMDSTLKESQRLKPSLLAAMHRITEDTVTLSDGTTIPKGSCTVVASTRMRDPEVYSDPETFDAYRFLKIRQTLDQETYAQATTPSPEHLGWGLGKHACPGRTLVVTEIKVALCHILMKYDWKLRDGIRPQPSRLGIVFAADGSTEMTIRRRKDSNSTWLDSMSGSIGDHGHDARETVPIDHK